MEREAKQFLAEQQVSVSRGVYLDESRGKVTFAEWAEQYFAIASRRLARTSYARDLVWLNTYLLPRWGRVPIGRITKAEVERWVVDLGPESASVTGRTLSPASVEKTPRS